MLYQSRLERWNLGRKPIQQRRKHVLGDVPGKLLHGSEVHFTSRASGLNDFVFPAHEG